MSPLWTLILPTQLRLPERWPCPREQGQTTPCILPPFLCVWLQRPHPPVLLLGFRFASEGLASRQARSCRCVSCNCLKTIVYKQQKEQVDPCSLFLF